MKFIFWFSLVGAAYSYFLYPLILILLPKRKHISSHIEDYEPRVSIIITAHNEETRIEKKILNTLALNYPQDLLEILVASDASTDRTDQLVREFEPQGIRLVRAKEHKGKEYAQLLAIRVAQGEVLVFSDVATEIKKDTITILVKRFAEQQVGAVSSEDRFITEDGSIAGEGAYVKYEMWLRKLESEVYSLVGLSGSFFAARRSICENWDIKVPSDFNTALNCARQGNVAVTDPNIIGYYKNIKHGKGEYARKFRTVIRGISAVASKPDVLNPFKLGLFAFEVWSHKIMRWLVPWFLIALFGASIALMQVHWIYVTALIAQMVFYSLVTIGLLSEVLRENILIRIPFYFIQVNTAIAHATVAFLMGKRITTWKPSKR